MLCISFKLFIEILIKQQDEGISKLLAVVYILSGSFNFLTDLLIFVLWIFFTLGVFGVFLMRRRGLSPKNYTLIKETYAALWLRDKRDGSIKILTKYHL